MNTSSRLKIVVSLMGIFVMGGITGNILSPRKVVAESAPLIEKWPAATLKSYEDRLKLTPEQMEKLRPVFSETAVELKRVRAQTVAEIIRVKKQMNGKVAQELTPEQQVEFEKMLDEMRVKAKAKNISPN